MDRKTENNTKFPQSTAIVNRVADWKTGAKNAYAKREETLQKTSKGFTNINPKKSNQIKKKLIWKL